MLQTRFLPPSSAMFGPDRMIPFVREMDFAYGRADQVSPLIRRVIANNPGPFTFTGTGTYIVGRVSPPRDPQ